MLALRTFLGINKRVEESLGEKTVFSPTKEYDHVIEDPLLSQQVYSEYQDKYELDGFEQVMAELPIEPFNAVTGDLSSLECVPLIGEGGVAISYDLKAKNGRRHVAKVESVFRDPKVPSK